MTTLSPFVTISCSTSSLCSGSCENEQYGPLFNQQADLKFIQCINRELLLTVGQYVIYYRVSEKYTKANIYGESKRKFFLNPIKIFARVEKQEPIQTIGTYSLDQEDRIIIYFDKFQLERFNLKPSVGDFIKFGDVNGIMYEILRVCPWQPVFGQPDQEILVKAECSNTRNTEVDFTYSEEESQ